MSIASFLSCKLGEIEQTGSRSQNTLVGQVGHLSLYGLGDESLASVRENINNTDRQQANG